MGFRELNIKSEYRSLSDNVVMDFYIPTLRNAVLYKRAVGFFSSSALIEISRGITGLIKNGGRIMLIASPKLQQEDVQAIAKGYEERTSVIERAVLNAITEPRDHFEEERLNLLANLIADGRLDIKIAFTEAGGGIGIYHEKMGLFYDNEDNIIAFTGSMNETSTAFMHNYETIDVFCSWTDENIRVRAKDSSFNTLWNDCEPNVSIVEFPKVAIEKLQTYKRGSMDMEIDQTEYCTSKPASTFNGPCVPNGIRLHDYQLDAIDGWAKRDFQGVFDMATGTGKTITGLGSVVKLYNHCNGKLAVFIVCPYQHLVDQWVEDISWFNIDPIIGYSSSAQKNYKKRLKNAIFDFNLGVNKFFCFICTNATFRLADIQKEISKLKGNALLVVDEAHNFGAMNISQTLTDTYNYRLALSATLERHNDEEGTLRLRKYFGDKCIEYPLTRAISEKKLTPYYYHPKVVTLSPEELQKYNFLTQEIGKCIIKDKNGKKRLSEKGKRIVLERARLVAGAIGKASLLCELMEYYKEDKHILVYCGATKLLDQDYDDSIEDIRQIDYITQKLGRHLGMKVSQFTSKEDNEERGILKKEFEKGDNLQALIAIKCLDEGVNIPMIKTAFILASTTNPKEYIQRRGRVLRLAKGKEYAVIYDFITLPREIDEVKQLTVEEVHKDKSLVKNEIKRMIEFKDLSLNPLDSDRFINDIIEAYDLHKDNEDMESDLS